MPKGMMGIYGAKGLLAVMAAWGAVSAQQTITLDGSIEGRRFDGIGAVSGGGGTSRLLLEYPEPQRSQMLDYLFKPNFGASLHILYVEVGADRNSTQGSEASHARTREEFTNPKLQNFQRGWQFWLMKEAKKRNPDIEFDICAWHAPDWVGAAPSTGGFWSQETADYYVSYIKGVKQFHGLDIHYTGMRNEKDWNNPFAKIYRKTLDQAGLTKVLIHGFDNWRPSKWDFAKEFATDPELEKAIGVVSNHVTWKKASEGYYPVPDYVLKSGKPIWDTEEHVYQAGFSSGISKVRASNENYIDSKVTSTSFWHLSTAFYAIQQWYEKHSMQFASSPWSGHYENKPEMWGFAHICQFTKPGWKLLDGQGSGYFANGGSYNTYKSPNGSDYSVVIETQDGRGNQIVSFRLAGGLAAKSVSVWRSNERIQFEKLPDIAPSNGAFTLTLEPGSIYSLTTTVGQQKGAHPAPPAQKPFPFPYHENYDHYKVNGLLPYYHSDLDRVYEVVTRPDGQGKCAQSVVPRRSTSGFLYTILGDAEWTDYEVSVDASLGAKAGAATLLGRVNWTRATFIPKAYMLQLASDGTWKILGSAEELATGKVAIPGQGWHNLKLAFQGAAIKAYIDNVQVGSVNNSGFTAGMAGLGAGQGGMPYFDNLIIKPVGGATPPPTVFTQDNPSVSVGKQTRVAASPGTGGRFNVTGGWFDLPKGIAGSKAVCTLYDLDGRTLGRAVVAKGRIHIQQEFGVSGGSYVLGIGKE